MVAVLGVCSGFSFPCAIDDDVDSRKREISHVVGACCLRVRSSFISPIFFTGRNNCSRKPVIHVEG